MKYIACLHGLLTFSLMLLVQVDNPYFKYMFCHESWLGSAADTGTVVKYAVQTCLAIVLWDFGMVKAVDRTYLVLLNFHHVGLFIALTYQSEASQAWRDTSMFGWFWIIYVVQIFVYIQRKVTKLLLPVRYWLQDGERSVAVDSVKHLYSLGTVFFMHQYLNGAGQPGVSFYNYQTWALYIMLTGRFLCNQNYKKVDFMRRIEVPGAFVLLVDHLFFGDDQYLRGGISTLLTVLLGGLTYAVFFKTVQRKPEQYVGPQENTELRALLDNHRQLVAQSSNSDGRAEGEDKTQGNISFIKGWFQGQRTKSGEPWTAEYPLIYAIIEGNLEECERLLKDTPELANSGMSTLHETRPLHWSVSLRRTDITMLLLNSGANPYLEELFNSKCAVDIGTSGKDSFGGSLQPDVVNFWKELHAICIKTAPPKEDWYDMSIFTRARKILAYF